MTSENLTTCDDFGELVSARLDNELSESEQLALDGHLAVCEVCRQRVATFGEIQLLVRSPIEFDGPQVARTLHGVWGHRSTSRHGRLRKWWSSAGTYATAAVLLLGFVGFIKTVQTEPRQTGSTAMQTAGSEELKLQRGRLLPLENLRVISHQQRRTQEMVRETLQWELRAMKLDLEQLELSEDQSTRLHQRVTELMDQLAFPSIRSPKPKHTGETI